MDSRFIRSFPITGRFTAASNLVLQTGNGVSLLPQNLGQLYEGTERSGRPQVNFTEGTELSGRPQGLSDRWPGLAGAFRSREVSTAASNPVFQTGTGADPLPQSQGSYERALGDVAMRLSARQSDSLRFRPPPTGRGEVPTYRDELISDAALQYGTDRYEAQRPTSGSALSYGSVPVEYGRSGHDPEASSYLHHCGTPHPVVRQLIPSVAPPTSVYETEGAGGQSEFSFAITFSHFRFHPVIRP